MYMNVARSEQGVGVDVAGRGAGAHLRALLRRGHRHQRVLVSAPVPAGCETREARNLNRYLIRHLLYSVAATATNASWCSQGQSLAVTVFYVPGCERREAHNLCRHRERTPAASCFVAATASNASWSVKVVHLSRHKWPR